METLGNAQPFTHSILVFVLFSAFSGKKLQGSALFSPRVLNLLLGNSDRSSRTSPDGDLGESRTLSLGTVHGRHVMVWDPWSWVLPHSWLWEPWPQHTKARAHIYLQSTKEMEALKFKWLNLWSGHQRGTSGAAGAPAAPPFRGVALQDPAAFPILS